jgi:hypothetical protein
MSIDPSYYFLATRPEPVHELVSLLIVTAYAGDPFLPRLLKKLGPKRAVVVLDESNPEDLADSVVAALGKKGRVWLGRATRIMHAKVYLLGWRRPGSSRVVYRLVLGSANASESGFAGTKGNAECLAWVPVSPTANPDLFRWAQSILEADQPVDIESTSERIGDLRLSLPALGLRLPKDTPAFDAWLQRGHLLHPYERDPSFLWLPVALKEALPLGGAGEVLATAGLVAPDGGRHLRWAYLGSRERKSGVAIRQWKARHFVETVLGPWTSDRCFALRGRTFVKAGVDDRCRDITRVATATQSDRDTWAEAFLDKVDAAAARLNTEELSTYFKTNDQVLDRDHYRAAAVRQLDRDHVKARDSEYADRFVRGVEIVRVPRFRDDAAAWENFAESFASTLLLQMAKGSQMNAISRALAEGDVLGEGDSGEDALKELRGRWPDVYERVEELLAEGFKADGDE